MEAAAVVAIGGVDLLLEVAAEGQLLAPMIQLVLEADEEAFEMGELLMSKALLALADKATTGKLTVLVP